MALFFEHLSCDVAASVVVVAIATIYMYIRIVSFSYWKRRNIPYLEPSFPFGHLSDLVWRKVGMGEKIQRIYEQSSGVPLLGIFAVTRPILVVNDLELVRNILIKDFAHFTDHGVDIDEAHDPLSGQLFSLRGEKWQRLRAAISPVFTSGKLKASFESLLNSAKSLQTFMVAAGARRDVVEVRDIAAAYSTDIIASLAFGLDINSLDDPDNHFRSLGKKAFALNVKNGLMFFAAVMIPKLQRILKIKVDQKIEDNFMDLVQTAIDYREKNQIVRKDLLQLLIQLRNTGQVAEDGNWDTKGQLKDVNKTLTFNQLTAQAWGFYIASFETTSSTMSFCMYELARSAECQQKVHAEIDAISTKYNGEITYESLAEMKYLESCIDETLRLYPVVPILNRECTKDYQFPGTEYRIAKGTPVFIPVLGIQRDPKYYTDPLVFRPERFANKDNNPTFTQRPFMAFGDGPRQCIAMRLARIQLKIGLHTMLRRNEVTLAQCMRDKVPRFSVDTFFLAAADGIHLQVLPRKNTM